MAKKRRKASEVAQDRGGGEFWIDHAVMAVDDLRWLKTDERLTLWNVDVPEGLLARLPKLWWLELLPSFSELQLLSLMVCRGLPSCLRSHRS